MEILTFYHIYESIPFQFVLFSPQSTASKLFLGWIYFPQFFLHPAISWCLWWWGSAISGWLVWLSACKALCSWYLARARQSSPHLGLLLLSTAWDISPEAHFPRQTKVSKCSRKNLMLNFLVLRCMTLKIRYLLYMESHRFNPTTITTTQLSLGSHRPYRVQIFNLPFVGALEATFSIGKTKDKLLRFLVYLNSKLSNRLTTTMHQDSCCMPTINISLTIGQTTNDTIQFICSYKSKVETPRSIWCHIVFSSSLIFNSPPSAEIDC
ncbi:hypothetical protein V2J09_022717 [Rumex salicifolius]